MQPTLMNNPVLQIGSTGPFVRELQTLLNGYGYQLAVDGIFGSLTQAAVIAHQHTFHNHLLRELPATGIVEHRTWQLIYADTYRKAPSAMPTLRLGSTGEAVQLIQTIFVQLGLHIGGALQFYIDGDFGPETAAAVKKMQEKYDVVIDGIVGPQTWQALGACVINTEGY